jgi:hypothetical protein
LNRKSIKEDKGTATNRDKGTATTTNNDKQTANGERGEQKKSNNFQFLGNLETFIS